MQSRQAGGTDRRSRVATIVNSGDRDDANNYVSIDDYRASASPWMTSTVLAQRWNAVHPDARVIVHGDSATRDAASNANAFTNCGVTRVFAAIQLLGGGLEVIVAGGALLAPEPTGATKVLGAIVMLHGIDTLQASARTGPESLASARGWSILARTGLRPGQATEVILLPSAANSSFVVVQPMGIFSTWQRLNGTVFSAGTGMFNHSTGAFTRTGVAANQLVVYSTDAAAMAMVRAAPGAMDIAFPP